MAKVAVYNVNGEQVGDIELADSIWNVVVNEHVLHEAVLMQQASLRRGTHKVKNRWEVRGGGRKPYKQKGTGNARQGSIRAPQYRGGGVVFGPTPRSYSYKLPKKVRRIALKSALSTKVKMGTVIVLDQLNFAAPKTKEMVKVLANLRVDRKALVVAGERGENVAISSRNIPGVKHVEPTGINVLDILNHQHLIITKDAVARVEEVFA